MVDKLNAIIERDKCQNYTKYDILDLVSRPGWGQIDHIVQTWLSQRVKYVVDKEADET